ncbi:PREDICTED: solute carrier family 23 member 1-like [Branchiostoma belcheri]|uniref:Solute carrier family 23 member 1-like n=1 Tax=Branchiostoma belcheri TaxID=7741 RepID=A0A6P4ZH74_BRABE|nr:PREDICTED: solute carrier family 23 member 1-like [Branchiostoma belcheri]
MSSVAGTEASTVGSESVFYSSRDEVRRIFAQARGRKVEEPKEGIDGPIFWIEGPEPEEKRDVIVDQELRSFTARAPEEDLDDIPSNVRSSTPVSQPPPYNDLDLQYTIEDVPPWPICIILGFQHYLTMFGATVALPLILSGPLCVGENNVAKGQLISTIFFVSGLSTLLQTTIGIRLPIVQGGTYTFLVPTFAILSLEKWSCPAEGDAGFGENETWQQRLREIQGAIMVSALFQVFIGFSGLMGIMLRFIGPLAIAPTIALVGLSLFEPAANFCGVQWGIACFTIFLVLLFSQYLAKFNAPALGWKDGRCGVIWWPVFKLFPVILAIICAWILSAILTAAGAYTSDPNNRQYLARTDARTSVLKEAPWFYFPYPGQWGTPTVSAAGVFGMLAGVLASMVESVGDYYACARLSGAPPPPIHAINRGIGMEGIGCLLAGMWGSGNGTTSYSENIGAIGITKVGSRRVIQIGGIIMILLAVFGKFGALFTTIPDPIIGGLFCCTFGMVTAVGISNLRHVDLNSSRNLFILGFSLIFGLVLPSWLRANPGAINTGVTELDQVITVLLSTNMAVGGLIGLILDNTIPGTLEQRGMLKWRGFMEDHPEYDRYMEGYNFPFGMNLIRKVACFRHVPFCPTFHEDFISFLTCGRKRSKNTDSQTPDTKPYAVDMTAEDSGMNSMIGDRLHHHRGSDTDFEDELPAIYPTRTSVL